MTGIPLIAEIKPLTNAYALVDDNNIRGGFRSVPDISTMNAIPSDKRKQGMEVYVVATDTNYVLASDLVTWTAQTSGGGGGTVEASEFIYNQVVPMSVWTINHNLNKYPVVVVVDSGNTVFIGDISYTDPNNLTITFSSTFGGKAYLT